ncbi:MAG: sugar phosphate nucleotidyltransferase, partial [Pseudomonadota bacterium]|nr:sugar phosphate nucleotidyltransferase [Pseudomonadota bacterium]
MSNKIRQAVIFAAGKGARFRPYSAMSPKALFKVNGEPLIKRSLEQIDRFFPDLDRIIILSGDDNGLIQKSLLTHSAVNKCDFISVPENYISMGLIGGYAFIKNQIGEEELFLSVLGDEYYGGKDHPRFVDFINKTEIISGCCAIKRFTYPDEYLKNYSVEIDSSNKITQITEKPTTVTSEYFGLGFFAARGHLCSLASDSVETLEKVELFDLLQKTSSPMAPLVGFEFKDTYVNINTPSDIYDCLRQTRREKQHSIDIIIPAWNEAKTIKYVVEDFLQYANSVIVMDNISEDGTARIARDAGAKVYSEPLKGYGDAIKKGLDRSSAD